MSIYRSNNPGSYTDEAGKIQSAVEATLQPLLLMAIDRYNLSVEDFFMLVSRAADVVIMDYNRHMAQSSEKHSKDGAT